MATVYNRPVDDVNVVTVNHDEVNEVRRAIEVCCAAPHVPVEFDGIPSRPPSAAEMAEASKAAPVWEDEADDDEVLGGASDPMAWIKRAQAKYSARMAKQAA
jgi:hypothetical protein